MTWESGMAADGNGGDGGECYRIEELRWGSKKKIIIFFYNMKCEDNGMA